MDVNEKVKDIILRNKVYIEQGDLDHVYDRSHDDYSLITNSHITELLYHAGLDVLNMITMVPYYFMFKTTYPYSILTIPKSIKAICTDAFTAVRGLKQLNLSCEQIHVRAFDTCYDLEIINIGKEVKVIEGNAFTNCNIKYVTYWGSKDQFKKICLNSEPENMFGDNVQYIFKG